MSEAKRGISRALQQTFVGDVARGRRVVVSWTAGGGIAVGGLSVGLAALDSPETAQGLIPLAPALFLVGAALGLAHGSVLAYLGRSEGVGKAAALAAAASGVLLSIPALAVAWVATAWISLTPAVLNLHAWGTTLVTVAGWVVGTVICCWAAVEGWESLCSAVARWPESRLGALLLIGAAAVLAVVFLRHRPGVWGTDLRLTRVGALILAMVSTLWIALPVVVVLLRYLHRRFASVWDGRKPSKKIVQSDL